MFGFSRRGLGGTGTGRQTFFKGLGAGRTKSGVGRRSGRREAEWGEECVGARGARKGRRGKKFSEGLGKRSDYFFLCGVVCVVWSLGRRGSWVCGEASWGTDFFLEAAREERLLDLF